MKSKNNKKAKKPEVAAKQQKCKCKFQITIYCGMKNSVGFGTQARFIYVLKPYDEQKLVLV